ncbi:helix-turn-helix transcriptional regulator [Natronorubrum sp. FCH18a]|uniref:helix-turn-helix transcriptional regulator n=1 Tax=Natronorubrum sp. FCH18a TaxID=3447018 RepID=UPI003F518775
MVFNTLWTRLSSLWSTGSTDETADGESSTDESDETDDETLSYAEEIEYGVDERDLPDEDKILRLLVKRGGRVDRSTVRNETGWSDDHLEDVINNMEDEGQVSAITVGRKRVICRRGFEPKGYRSHLNE